MKYGVIYYSFSGNTAQIAERIKVAKHADIGRIETVTPYPEDFDALLEQGKVEIERKFLPEIKPLALDVSAYDKLIIGTPTWWYTAAPALFSFLKTARFQWQRSGVLSNAWRRAGQCDRRYGSDLSRSAFRRFYGHLFRLLP